jgi:hypothetical protein
MIKFKPVGYNQTHNPRTNTTSINSINLGRIYSPYVGVVNDTHSNECEGYVEIKHMIDDSEFYSRYCNVDKIVVSRGDKIKSGDVIGYTKQKDEDVIYSLSKDNKKINPENYFRNNKFLSNKDELTKKDKEPKKQEHTPKKVTNSDGPSGRLLSSLFLSPLDFTGKNLEKGIDSVKDEFRNMKSVKSKKKKEEDSLNEEINRIKKLL